MYYEVYIDVIFLVNMIMNFLLLWIVRKILKCKTSNLRLISGSIAGALGMCVLIFFPAMDPVISFFIKYGLISLLMIRIGLNIKEIRELLKSMIVLYMITFLFGGILEFLYNQTVFMQFYHSFISGNSKAAISFRTFLIIGFLGFIVMNLGLKAYEYYKVVLRHVYPVTIIYKGKPMKISGFLDTGNSLTDPITKKPVSIINIQNIEKLLEEDIREYLVDFYSGFNNGACKEYENAEKIKYIPYHSIGKKHGILPAITVDICITVNDKPIIFEKTILGVCEEPIGGGLVYQMILNPELIG